jgi:hypothetical protein
MLQKILLDRDYIPDTCFDWSLAPGVSFPKIDPNDRHSSISSQGIGSTEEVECDQKDRVENIAQMQVAYNLSKHTAMPLLKQASNSMLG